MKFIAFLTALVLAFSLLPALPAQAAVTCGPQRYKEVNIYRNVDDDESRSYVRFFSRNYYANCSNGRQLQAIQYGYAPWRAHNTKLSCNDTIIRSIRMNPGPIGGYNYKTTTLACRANGNSVYRNFTNRYSTDRGFGVDVTVDKKLLPDRHYRIPNNAV